MAIGWANTWRNLAPSCFAVALLFAEPVAARQEAASITASIAAVGRSAGVEILVRDPPVRHPTHFSLRSNLSPRAAVASLARAFGLTVVELGPRRFMLVRPPPDRPRQPDPVIPAGDIVVQAGRIDERAGSAPVSIGALGAADLRTAQVRRLDDLSGTVPGLIVTSQTSGTTPLFVLRGQRRAVGDTLRLPVVTYLAEVPLPNEGGLLPVFDMAGVQVLRGPQGTLFGRNTTAGAILLTPERPSQTLGGYADTTLGDHGLVTLEGAMTGPLGPDVAIRVAGQISRRSGLVRDTAQQVGLDDVHSDAARAILVATPSATVTQTMMVDWLNANEHGVADILIGVYPAPGVPGGGSARMPAAAPYFDCGQPGCDIDDALAEQQQRGIRRTATGIVPRAHRAIAGLSSTTEIGDRSRMGRLILGYRSTRIETQQDQDGTPLPILDVTERVSRRQLTAEVQMRGQTISAIDWVGGLFASDSRPVGDNTTITYNLLRPGVAPVYRARYERIVNLAAYGEVHVPMTPKLRLTLGARYGWDWISGCGIVRASETVRSAAACAAQGGTRGNVRAGAPSWTLGLDRRDGDTLLYVVTRRAYRPAGFNVPALGPALAQYQTFRPETLDDLEIGAKRQWRIDGWRGSAAIDIYAGRYRNIQRTLVPSTGMDGDGDAENDPVSLVVNAARARISGVEASAEIERDGSRIGLAGTITDARYSAFDVAPVLRPLLGDDPVSNVFSYTPRWTAIISARYRLPVARRLGNPHIGAVLRAQGRTYFSGRREDPFTVQPSYMLVDMDADWSAIGGTRVDLGLFVRNLFDRTYMIGGGVVTPAITTATAIYGAPRTIGGRMRITF
ncbi:TonB-dependent receptor [Sphingomonas sp. GB1N7]